METSFSASTLEAPNQERLQNYSDNIGFGIALNAEQQQGKDAMVSRMAGYLNFAEDNGVNLADGATGSEIRTMTDLISANKPFQAKLQKKHREFDKIQNTLGFERIFKGKDINATGVDFHGEYDRNGDILTNENGNPNDSVDQDAIDFNDFTGRVITEAPLTAKPQGGGDGGAGGNGGDGQKTKAANAKQDTAPKANDQSGMDERNFWAYILSTFDTDGDGVISADEMKIGMAKLDKNKDGKLTKDELLEGGFTEAKADSMLAGMDKDGDKQISLDGDKSEVSAFMTAANKDGKDGISKSEGNDAMAMIIASNPSLMNASNASMYNS
jgi:EF hand